MQDSLKIEYTPTHYRREHNVSQKTQASFFAKFKAIRNKLGQKRHLYRKMLFNHDPSQHATEVYFSKNQNQDNLLPLKFNDNTV